MLFSVLFYSQGCIGNVQMLEQAMLSAGTQKCLWRQHFSVSLIASHDLRWSWLQQKTVLTMDKFLFRWKMVECFVQVAHLLEWTFRWSFLGDVPCQDMSWGWVWQTSRCYDVHQDSECRPSWFWETKAQALKFEIYLGLSKWIQGKL